MGKFGKRCRKVCWSVGEMWRSVEKCVRCGGGVESVGGSVEQGESAGRDVGEVWVEMKGSVWG